MDLSRVSSARRPDESRNNSFSHCWYAPLRWSFLSQRLFSLLERIPNGFSTKLLQGAGAMEGPRGLIPPQRSHRQGERRSRHAGTMLKPYRRQGPPSATMPMIHGRWHRWMPPAAISMPVTPVMRPAPGWRGASARWRRTQRKQWHDARPVVGHDQRAHKRSYTARLAPTMALRAVRTGNTNDQQTRRQRQPT